MTASVSVCLCTFNGKAHLEEQLRSLSSQSRLPDEVVVGDDGSTDGTSELLELWAASAPMTVLIERSAGAGHAANLESVLGRASSETVFICDQDDRWSSDKVEATAAALERASGAAGAFSDSAIIDESGRPLPGSLWETLGFSTAEQDQVRAGRGLSVLLRRNVVAGHALAFRRDRLELLLPFPDLRHADWWLALGLLLDGGLLPMSERLVDYRLHSGNTVGLRSRSNAAGLVGSTDPRERSRSDAALLEALVDRFDERRPGRLSDSDRALISAKVAHAERRACLSSSRLARIAPVVAELARGGYRRFGNGWRSAAMDLTARAR